MDSGQLTDRLTTSKANQSNLKAAAFSILGPSTQQMSQEQKH
jgi:hypothetical protein